ncbi:tetratricopeptide repeat protein [Novosphingobium colocasiae]|uniref:Tetratricopeptide repeat protein n=1 Tax=Novosphingobium colocasiae TaxID=1256513 RepID=A0A918PBH5_9SPHN|nr:tetratricopeptide repeat protein [Novosphingobium colocasiae]GGY96925.1 hypothetical protein GCM10011614_09850 [Novosphingobium colocasiae]
MKAAGAALGLLALAGSAVAGLADQPGRQKLVDEARAAIARGDGIDAEMKLRAAMQQGANRQQVAAYMGEAYLAQENPDKARVWLGSHDFTPQSAAAGWRALAALEKLDGNLPASGRAYDKVLALTPNDPTLWVDIGRLRYAGGEHALAIDAARRALQLGPGNVRALEFGGQLVRDRYGLAAGTPWFERALMRDKDDVPVLLEYAATLGDLGRNAEMLTLTRRVLQLKPKNPRAFYLQAVLAARAGNYAIARSLLGRTRGRLDGLPGVMLLHGVVELAAGNYSASSEALEKLLQARPDNQQARELLARAIYLGGQYRYATLRFAPDLAREDASPYLLTTVARAYEALGDRAKAGALLDRAALPVRAVLRVDSLGSEAGALLSQGRAHGAADVAEADRARDPGFYDTSAIAGDVQLALGNARGAEALYATAAQIRMPESLFQRRFEAMVLSGDLKGAGTLVDAYLRENPTSRAGLRAAAWLALGAGDAARARAILGWLRDNGGQRDVQLLSDLAVLAAGSGDAQEGEVDALTAYRLQRASPLAAQALAYTLARQGQRGNEAADLLAKARAMTGGTPITAAAYAALKPAG